ncbi:MAG: ribokinase [Gammaproteobacteria bacterium]|nr:ribokinase [Gammaproteobacteria bacterium]
MPKLVNLGSLGIDHVYGVDHITTPGETISSYSHDVFPGGKGSNQSIAAAKAGAEVVHVGCIGPDGDMLLDVLSEVNVDVKNVRVSETATQHAVIQVDRQGQNAIVIFGGANRTLNQHDRDVALSRVEPGDWLLLQNEVNDLEEILDQAGERNVSVAFNVAPVDGREKDYDYSRVGLLIVNEVEAAALAAEDDPNRAFDILTSRFPDMIVLLTLGRDGGMYGGGGYPRVVYESHVVDAVDETAAGDTFIGYFMAEWLKSQDLAKAVEDASAAGAIAVTKPGAASSIPSRAEVDAFKESVTN